MKKSKKHHLFYLKKKRKKKNLPYSRWKREGDTHQVEPLRLRQILRRKGGRGPPLGLSPGEALVELPQLLAPLPHRLLLALLGRLHRLPRLYRPVVASVAPHHHSSPNVKLLASDINHSVLLLR